MELRKVSPISGKMNTLVLNCTEEEYEYGMNEREHGAMIQDAFPMLSPEEREFIKTGITPEEWDAMF